MRQFLLIIFLLIGTTIAEGRTTLVVHDQPSFDLLPQKITETIRIGEMYIDICFLPGKYFFKNKHLSFIGIQHADLTIRIKGNKAILIPEGKNYSNGDDKKGALSIYHGWMNEKNDISIWSPIIQADNLVEIVDLDNKLCRLKSSLSLKDSEEGTQSILLTQWYKSSTYSVKKIKNNYIYFNAPDLSYSAYKKTEYSINDDFNYFSKYPRYKLCNVDESANAQSIVVNNGKIVLPQGISEVHECNVSTFLYVENCSISSFKMDGFEFWGSSYGYPEAFITFKKTQAPNIEISNCSFYGMHNNVVSILNSDNVTVTNNYFKDLYHSGIQSDNGSANTRVINNSFEDAGLGLSNTFCIFCSGKNYYIYGNKLTDYGYGGIRVGLWYLNKQYGKSNGVVENNTLLFSEDYMNAIYKNGLMDGGAIYISTINDKAIIRHNYIDGYRGAGGNRGIFCDDGAMGCEIYGNVILNIGKNDYCIASRREPAVEKKNDPRSSVLKSNVNNVIRDNLIDGKILFKGHESINNGCVKGANYVVLADGADAPVNQIENIPSLEDDIIINNAVGSDKLIRVPRDNFRIMRKSKEWRFLQNYVKRR